MKHFILLLACVLSLLLFSSCSTPAKNEAALSRQTSQII